MKLKKIWKLMFALFLSSAMLVTSMPVTALAANGDALSPVEEEMIAQSGTEESVPATEQARYLWDGSASVGPKDSEGELKNVSYSVSSDHLDISLTTDGFQDAYICYAESEYRWAVYFSDSNYEYRIGTDRDGNSEQMGLLTIPELNCSLAVNIDDEWYYFAETVCSVEGNTISWSADLVDDEWAWNMDTDSIQITGYEILESLDEAIGQTNLKWDIDEDGKLTIENAAEGEGMPLAELYLISTQVKSLDLDVDLFEATERLFAGFPNLETATLKVDSVSGNVLCGLFENCTSLRSVDLSGFNAEGVTDVDYFFHGCSSLQEINLSGFNTSTILSMAEMFDGCSSLETVDLSGLDISNVTSMNEMFHDCTKLKTVSLKGLHSDYLFDMSAMFSQCRQLASIDFEDFDTSNVEDMSYMFDGCCSLASLDLSGFDTTNVTDMSYMFSIGYYYCDEEEERWISSLKELDLASFNTANVTDMRGMFESCVGLEKLNISSFDTSNVEFMNNMFSNCIRLQELDVSHFDTARVSNICNMFDGCASLRELDVSHFNTSNVTDMAGMFNMSYYDEEEDANKSEIRYLDVSGFDTSKVEDMSSMFMGCAQLENLDVSGFNTSNVKDMNWMFAECSSLTTLDLSSFNTASVYDMTHMFYGCSGLTELDLSSFDTSNVEDMSWMFAECSGLTTLDLSSFNTACVCDMNCMFYECSGLTELDLSSFNTENVLTMNCMFFDCNSLAELDLSSFNTANVYNVGDMFNACYSLTELNLSSFDLSAVAEGYEYYFLCELKNIKRIKTPKNVSLDFALPDIYPYVWINIETMEKEDMLPKGLSSSVELTTMERAPEITVAFYEEGVVELRWKASIETEHYRVFRKTSDSEWEVLADVDKNQYTDATVQEGKNYIYAVQGITADGENICSLRSDPGKNVSTTTEYFAPELKKVREGNNYIMLAWKANNGISRYRVMRKKEGESWKAIGDVTGSMYNDLDVTPGCTYTYSVMGISKDGTRELTGYDNTGLEASCRTKEESSYEILKDADGKVYDLGGMEIVVRDWWTEPDYKEDTEYANDREEYTEWLEQTYNFKITRKEISDWYSVSDDFYDYVTDGGDASNYVFYMREGSELTSFMNAGLCYDLSTLDCLDFENEKFRSNRVHEKYRRGEAVYAMSGDAVEPKIGVFFNKQVLAEAGIDPESIYDMQADGTWTWDAMKEIMDQVQRDTDGDGTIDVYGASGNGEMLTEAAVYSNGSEFVGKDEDGFYESHMEDPATIEGLKFAQELYENYFDPEAYSWDYYANSFVDGASAFLFEEAWAAREHTSLTDQMGDLGFVMFPKGPCATDYTNCWANNPLVIPSCYDEERAWKIAFAWNLYTDEVPGYEGSGEWKQIYYDGIGDSRAVDETLEMMRTKGMITFHAVVTDLVEEYEPGFIWYMGPDMTDAEVLASNVAARWADYVDTENERLRQNTSTTPMLNYKHNCSFGNNLSFYFAIPVSSLKGYSNIRLVCKKQVFDQTGENYEIVTNELDKPQKTSISGEDYYMFEYSNIAAKQMGDQIMARVYADRDGKTYISNSDIYSIQEYAYERLENSTNQKFKTLVVDMLNYGSCAQTHFAYNTNHLVNEELTDEQRAQGTANLPKLKSVDQSTETEGAPVAIVRKNVVFGNNIELVFAMTFPENYDRSDVKLEISYTSADNTLKSAVINGSDLTATTIEDVPVYTGKITTIRAKDLGAEVTARVTKNGDVISNVQKYSVESYAKSRLEKSKDENFKALTAALMKYGKAAEAYLTK